MQCSLLVSLSVGGSFSFSMGGGGSTQQSRKLKTNRHKGNLSFLHIFSDFPSCAYVSPIFWIFGFFVLLLLDGIVANVVSLVQLGPLAVLRDSSEKQFKKRSFRDAYPEDIQGSFRQDKIWSPKKTSG